MHEVYTKALRVSQVALVLLLAVVAALLAGWAFPEGGVPYLAFLVCGVIGAGVVHFLAPSRSTHFGFSFWAMVFINVLVNGHIYPHLLSYQANATAGRWAHEQGLTSDRLLSVNVGGTALNFYTGYTVNDYVPLDRRTS